MLLKWPNHNDFAWGMCWHNAVPCVWAVETAAQAVQWAVETATWPVFFDSTDVAKFMPYWQ